MRRSILSLAVLVAAVAASPSPVSAQGPDSPDSIVAMHSNVSPDSGAMVELRAAPSIESKIHAPVPMPEPVPQPNVPLEFTFAVLAAGATARKGSEKKKKAAAKEPAAKPPVAPPVAVTPLRSPGNPEFEKRVELDQKATTGSDTTVPGGRYKAADGVWRDSEGRALKDQED